MNIALFASGKGTNVKNILHYFKGNKTGLTLRYKKK